jgi:hypothetical protein
MGTFAEILSVDNRLSFADQGKQTSVFDLQKITGSLPFPFTVYRKQRKLPFSVRSVFHIYILEQQHIYM